MDKKMVSLLGALTLSFIPFTAFADLVIQNNTNSPATAVAGSSPCSSAAGDRGVIKAHGKVSIPDFLLGMYCDKPCKAMVYMTQNCTGKSIATILGSKAAGVIDVQNTDTSKPPYHIEGRGKNVSIEGGPQLNWFQKLFS